MLDRYEGDSEPSANAFALALEWALGRVSTEMCDIEMERLSEAHLQGNTHNPALG